MMEGEKKKGIVTSVLGLVLATACCWGPWVLIAIGSSTGLLAANSSLEKYMPYFMVIGGFFLLRGVWQLIKARKLKKAGNLPLCCREGDQG